MTIRPFTKDDWPQFLGRAFTRRVSPDTADVFIPTSATIVGVISSGNYVLYETFAEHYVFAQTGKSAGIEAGE